MKWIKLLCEDSWDELQRKYQAERQRIKDRIRDIVGDDSADEVYKYWYRIKNGFNRSWEADDGFKGDCYEHLDRLSDMLGPEGKDIIDDIQAEYDREDKSLREYYDTRDFTGD